MTWRGITIAILMVLLFLAIGGWLDNDVELIPAQVCENNGGITCRTIP